MSIVKICGIRDARIGIAAAEAGADYLGFMFAPSKRQVTAIEVAAIIGEIRDAGFPTRAVGVFVDPTQEALQETIAISGIELVQLSGDETPELTNEMSVGVIKAFPAGADDVEEELLNQMQSWNRAKHVLLDARDATMRGGTGKRANWELAARLTRHIPVILAGGLDPEHVMSAISTVRPMGVDVSSGVETNGQKDPEKIRRFVNNAREAFSRLDVL